ncbi:hypothetical protein RVR_3223 [Actinacidiphila reveromycinica]|uniref:Uncharacterized protein n=1 Tax=Actinacidiphila reveromycinica TaxID=659352 RepID=A0A7U3URM8_9ACTN|nr:hypothetical protein RVR_3223 [Streptomyces sp. SN-593]
MKILSTLVRADAGEVRVGGHAWHANRRPSGPRSGSPDSFPSAR